MLRRKLTILLLATIAISAAQEPWRKKPELWTSTDAEILLSDSPWAQTASASLADTPREDGPASVYSLPGAAEAGMAGPRGVSDGHWDGGVGRNTGGSLPTVPVTVRWESASPIRQALTQLKRSPALNPDRLANSYVIAILGLVPAGRYSNTRRSDSKSSSDDGNEQANSSEQILGGIMAHSALAVRGRAPLACEDAKLDDATGAVYLFFARKPPIQLSDKEVAVRTRFGSLVVNKKFRLSDMKYQGSLEL
jgi:hypothetical protein